MKFEIKGMQENPEMVELQIKALKRRVLEVKDTDFEELAIEIFKFQARHNPIYQSFLRMLDCSVDSVQSMDQIPFMPIELFKTFQVQTGFSPVLFDFESSGTTGQIPAKHAVCDPGFYQLNSLNAFNQLFGSITDYHIFALLPSYLERNTSSLVFMMDHFIQESKSEFSGFFLNQYAELLSQIQEALKTNRKIWVMGVTFGLLDWIDSGQEFLFWKEAIHEGRIMVMETGGMKGRREEWIRDRIHAYMMQHMGLKGVASEYGMTELFSQAYSFSDGIFVPSNTMRVLLREVNDPFSLVKTPGKIGGIKVIDLANVESCSFIETRDLGSLEEDGIRFKVLGRFDNSEMRGCSLMVSEPY
jgi:hypothetical protein